MEKQNQNLEVDMGADALKSTAESGEDSGAPGAPDLDQAVVEPADSRLAALAEERDRLAAEKDELRDLLQRRQAEFENFRRRVSRERAELSEYAAMECIREILPILDDFERALAAETKDENYAAGMKLIYQHMVDALRRQGLEPLEAAGKPFDPNIHEAIDMVQTTEVADHTVVYEFQKGYNFKGRLLRPARVKVAVHPTVSQ